MKITRYESPILECINKVSNDMIEDNAWYTVLISIILLMGLTITLGTAAWCKYYKGKRFTGSYRFVNWGLSVRFQCI